MLSDQGARVFWLAPPPQRSDTGFVANDKLKSVCDDKRKGSSAEAPAACVKRNSNNIPQDALLTNHCGYAKVATPRLG